MAACGCGIQHEPVYVSASQAIRPVLLAERCSTNTTTAATSAAGVGSNLTPPEIAAAAAAFASASYHERGLQRLFVDAARNKLREMRLSEHAELFYACTFADVAELDNACYLHYHMATPTGGEEPLARVGFKLAQELTSDIIQMVGKTSSLTTQSAAHLAWSIASIGLTTSKEFGRLFEELMATLQPTARIQVCSA